MRAPSLFAVVLLALPAPAARALSCARPDVAQAYLTADASTDSYIVVLGTLDFDPDLLPRSDGTRLATDTSVPARLQARGITVGGFSAWIDRAVTLNVTCAGPWCGSAVPGAQMLMFLRRTDDGDTLDLGPCPQFAFPDPAAADLATLRRCLSGGRCEPRFR